MSAARVLSILQSNIDPSAFIALLILAYASILIYMHSRIERPVGLQEDSPQAALLSAPSEDSSKSNPSPPKPSRKGEKHDPQQKTERLLRTIHMGKDYIASSSSTDDMDRHSPGTKKKFQWSHFFDTEPMLIPAAPALFADLREKYFGMPPEKYYGKHLSGEGTKEGTAIKPSESSLGFSGSQFYFTHDKALIIKSVPRAFESGFLLDKMLDAYGQHITQAYTKDPSDPNKPTYSLLTPITDVLYPPYHNLLGMLGIGGEGGVWIIMKNTLLLTPPGEGDKFIKASTEWDLKPPHFFEPTRDLVPDRLKSSAAKSGLADIHIPLKDRPVVTSHKRDELLTVFRRDTEFLSSMHTVDYSILLGRWDRESYPYSLGPVEEQKWSEGVESKDGKWVYRITLVDFLWSQKGGIRPRVTKTAGKAIPEQTISTEPDRYKDAVVSVCEEWILTESPGREEVQREEREEQEEEDG